MTDPPFLTAKNLAKTNGISHGFFSRSGGVSDGIYASLNTGPGSNDDPANVFENRKRCAYAIGAPDASLLTGYQIHSANVVTVDKPWSGERPKADAIVTNTPGLALGVLTADCMPWLMADPEAGVIASAHAGWRGALNGVLENTVAAMESIGANRDNIRAALGPCLRQPNFEVGLELLDAFTNRHPWSVQYFAAGEKTEKRQLDLARFGAECLKRAGVNDIDDLSICTLAAPDHYFSYRASRQRGEDDYGRNLSAIALV